MTATASPNYSDQQLLASDSTFQNRVRQSLMKACSSIINEGWAVVFHRERQTFAVACMNAPDTFKLIVAQAVATDAGVIGDATVAGATPLTSGNVAAQAALVTDGHMDTAVAANFNSFFRTPQS